ncbi:MAG: NCS2 family permease [Firmicutes bacterium]|nr:NCS2 family permease [Bacillota bacterium]
MSDFFKLKERGTDVKTEFLAGLTTFMTMAYILAVNPSILSASGMPQAEVFTATVIASVVGTLAMAFLANLPFALAPGMGLNAFLTYTIVFGMGYTWQFALLAVFIEGLVFIILSVTPVREAMMNSIPQNLKYGIAAGIGLFIALIGLENAGVVIASASTAVDLGNITAAGPCLALVGLLIIGILHHKKVKGAILIGIFATWILGILAQLIGWYKVDIEAGVYSLIPSGIISLPSGIPTIGGACFDFATIRSSFATTGDFILNLFVIMFSFMFVDIFDTMGTLIGVATKSNMLDENGKLPKTKEALLADAIATSVGAIAGTSTTTTFVESSAGVAQGGRTGLTAVFVAGFFILSLFFSPIFLAIPSFATAPALIFVGFLMLESIMKVEYENVTEALPAYIACIAMPFCYSISTGISFGIISYVVINACCGKAKKINLVMWILCAIFVAYYIFVK